MLSDVFSCVPGNAVVLLYLGFSRQLFLVLWTEYRTSQVSPMAIEYRKSKKKKPV